jgi:hypothetical protein
MLLLRCRSLLERSRESLLLHSLYQWRAAAANARERRLIGLLKLAEDRALHISEKVFIAMIVMHWRAAVTRVQKNRANVIEYLKGQHTQLSVSSPSPLSPSSPYLSSRAVMRSGHVLAFREFSVIQALADKSMRKVWIDSAFNAIANTMMMTATIRMMVMLMAMMTTVTPFLQVMQSWFSSVKLLKVARSQAVTLEKMRRDALAGACFNRWRIFFRTITSARSSISRAIDYHVTIKYLVLWHQTAAFQSAARNLIAEAAVESMEQLRSVRATQGAAAICLKVLKEWRRVSRQVADIRSRACDVHSRVLERIVVQVFRQWQRKRRIRNRLQELGFADVGSRMMRVMRVWRVWARRVKYYRICTFVFKEKKVASYLSTCFWVLRDHLKRRSRMKAAASGVYALTERVRGELLGRILGEWRSVGTPRKMAMMAAMRGYILVSFPIPFSFSSLSSMFSSCILCIERDSCGQMEANCRLEEQAQGAEG